MAQLPRPAAIPARVSTADIRAWLQPSSDSGNIVAYGTDGNLKAVNQGGKTFTTKLALHSGWTTDPARPLHITQYGSMVMLRGTVQRTVDPSYWNGQKLTVAEIPGNLSPNNNVHAVTCGYHGSEMDGNSQVETTVWSQTADRLCTLAITLLRLQDAYPDLPKDFWFPVNLVWVI